MVQETKVIDIRRSYIPIDPNAFPATDHATEDEDKPEPRIPVIAYDGYNFMPTPQGYSSFFGVNSVLGIESLITSGGSGNVDDLFMIQTNLLQNILVALCDDGIWTKSANSSGNWFQVIPLTIPAAGTHKLWSKCVIENIIYVYRQGEASVWQAGPTNSYVFTAFVPTTLNMAGQLGIFKAGGRLGFWDSENSTAWAALGDPTDATPDTKTLAGSTIFQDIVGRIVVVLQHGNGFIIYCTKSIVLVIRNINSPLIWSGSAIFNSNGISYREEACFAEPDTHHYAFTTQGIVEIVNGKAEFVIPEVGTYLKEKRQPVYLKMLNGRYLFFPILDPYYFVGITRFITELFDAQTFTFKHASVTVEGFEGDGYENACHVINAINGAADTIFINDILGKTSYATTNAAASVPIWEDHLSLNIPKADIEAYKATGIGGFGNADYFDNTGFTLGLIPKITAGNESFIPTKGPSLVATYPATRPIEHIEVNENNFYWKQDWIWFYERRMWDSWKEAIYRKAHAVINGTPITKLFASIPSILAYNIPVTTKYIFGPYIDLSYFSEINKYYGLSASRKSAWLQRSLTKSMSIEVASIVTQFTPGVELAQWIVSSDPIGGVGGLEFPSYAYLISASGGLADIIAAIMIEFPTQTVTFDTIVSEVEGVPNVTTRQVNLRFNLNIAEPPNDLTVTFGITLISANSTYQENLPVGQEAYSTVVTPQQTFSTPKFKYQDYPVCTYKNLGFTKIKGHGHYTLAGAFVVDDAIPEAADYTDQCTLSPSKRKQPFLLGQPINNDSLSCGNATLDFDGVTYTYPDITITIPGGTILLQEGSIEPIYPTFLGAFVYDTQYKKWGKMQQNYKQILDYFPINNIAGDSPIPYDTFLPKCAALLESGLIALFDQFPTDSRIIFGKVGMYRKGFTDMQEVRIQNRTPLSGSVTVEGSLDGKNVESSITQTQAFADATQVTANMNLSARWYNIIVEGNYDITAMEARTTKKGKR